MKKHDKFAISIRFDDRTMWYMEITKSWIDKSYSPLFRRLLKEKFNNIIQTNACLKCKLSVELDTLPKTNRITIRMDEESLEILDFLVGESGLPRSVILRGLLRKEFLPYDKYCLSLKQCTH